MKKILGYTVVAVFLGAVTMLAPLPLLISEIDISEMDTQGQRFYPSPTEYTQATSSKAEQTYGIAPATYPLDVLFIAFMLTLSLAVALGVMRHFKRKTVS